MRPAIPHRRSTERPGQSEQGNPTSDITGQTATGSVPKANESNPRKRNRGFGLDEDDLAVHEEDFTPEEWNVLKVQVEKAEEEAAKAAQELAPPTKKRRVDENPQQQKRTRQSDRHNTSGTSRQTQPPARQPGFIPNKRGTFAPPDLPTIDSSRLMSDPDSPSNTKDPQTTPQTPSDDEINMPGAFHGSKSKTKNKDPPSSPKGMTVSGVIVPERPFSYCDLDTAVAWLRTRSTHRMRRTVRNPRLTHSSSLASDGETLKTVGPSQVGAMKANLRAANQHIMTQQCRDSTRNDKIDEQRFAHREETAASSSSRPVVRFKLPESFFVPEPSPRRRVSDIACSVGKSAAWFLNTRTPLRSVLKRKRETQAPAYDNLMSSPDLPNPPRLIKRPRGAQAPELSGSSSYFSWRTGKPKKAAASPLPSPTPQRSPYNVASRLVSLAQGLFTTGLPPSSPPAESAWNRGFPGTDLWASSSSASSDSGIDEPGLSPYCPTLRRSPYNLALQFASLTPDCFAAGRRRSSPLTVVPHYPARRYGPLSGYMANKLPGYVANKLHSKLVSENDIETENVNDEQGSSPLTRARNKAEQFKPKTPSRLRESARFPTSNQSTPAGLDMSSPSFSDAFQNSTPVQSRPLPVDDSPFLVHADKIPPLAGPTTSDSSLPRLQSEGELPRTIQNAHGIY